LITAPSRSALVLLKSNRLRKTQTLPVTPLDIFSCNVIPASLSVFLRIGKTFFLDPGIYRNKGMLLKSPG